MPSTVIEKYYYKKESQILTIVFVSGIVYKYKNVPEHIYKKMKASFSKGIFLNTYIKGVYDFEKVGQLLSSRIFIKIYK